MLDVQNKDQSLLKDRLLQLLDYVSYQSSSGARLQYELPAKSYSASQLKQVSGLQLLSSDWLFKIERLPAPEPFLLDARYQPFFQTDEADQPSPDLKAMTALGLRPVTVPLFRLPYACLQPVLNPLLVLWQDVQDVLQRWQVWRDAAASTLDSILLYNRLFAWANALEMGGFPDGSELVAGFGLIQWRLPSGKAYRYPLVTLPIEFFIDEWAAIYVGLKPIRPALEMQAFLAEDEIAHAAKVRESLLEEYQDQGFPLDFFDVSAYGALLDRFVALMHPRGCVTDERVSAELRDYPLALAESFIFMRPHTSNVLMDDIQALKRDLQRPERQITGHIAAFVTELSDEAAAPERQVVYRGRSGSYGEGAEVQDLYFPLPYNAEQVLIAKKLMQSDGVVVRGAPGTGKTHTIANIVSHSLAQGHKVLITAHQAHVLHTLAEKLPPEIRALAISRTGSSQESKRQLDRNIDHIIEKLSHLNESEYQQRIDELSQLVDQSHAAMQQIDLQIRDLGQGQFEVIEYQQQLFNASDLMELIAKDEPLHDWFEDIRLPIGPEGAFPLEPMMLTALKNARQDLGVDLLLYAHGEIPAAELLWNEREISTIAQNLSECVAARESLESSPFQWLSHYPESDLEDLSQKLSEAVIELRTLTGLKDFQAEVFFEACTEARVELELLRELLMDDELLSLVEYRKDLLRKPVQIKEQVEPGSALFAAIERGAHKGQPLSWYNFDTGLRAAVAAIRVGGTAPQSALDWRVVEIFVRYQQRYLSIVSRWNALAKKLGFSQLQSNLGLESALEDLSNYIRYFERASRFYSRDLGEIRLRCAGGFSGQLPDLSDPKNLEILNSYMHQLLTTRRLVASETDFINRLQALEGMSFYRSPELIACLKQIAAQNQTQAALRNYLSIVAVLDRLRDGRDLYQLVYESSGYFEQLGAKKLAHDLLNIPVDDMLGDRVLRDGLREAWEWRRIRSHLNTLVDVRIFDDLVQQRKTLETRLAKAYEDLVASRSWLALKQNASEKTLVALNRYKISVQKIGKGKGKNAARYRRDAQDALLQITNVIPCWIMSQQQVSESMPGELEMFDLVIVDEASQSSIESFPVIMRGKKLLVVGDNKQVSPSNVGLSVEQIELLRSKYLNAQPHRDYLTPDMSLYDTASSVYQSGVMLLEHFRCHPDIIAYSNQQFYANRIKPMRVPKRSELLTPTLVPIHVPDGLRESKGAKHRNRREAEVIIEEMGRLLSLPQYRGRSMGVISLLGAAQAELIQALALQAFGAEALLSVQFACGEASAFQGAERDIMFLTMVADPQHCSPLSSLAHEQRFNVAASRARDRMYLVTSVLSGDLSAKDLRQGLLAHFYNRTTRPVLDDADKYSLCSSSFEIQVLQELLVRGYRVQPKVTAGEYQIDLVVESSSDLRLAIECDGDTDMQQWLCDLQKQRDLERAGWVFVRCFMLAWQRDLKASVRAVIEVLHRMGIHPDKQPPSKNQIATVAPSIVPFNPKAIAAMLNAGIKLQTYTNNRQRARMHLINWKIRTSPEQFVEENIAVYGDQTQS